jgi:DNA mismatch repair ATPase MutS
MMEIGKFYEVYTFETEEGERGRAKEMSRVCNIVLTRKNKNNAPSLSNPYMCGFPSHSLTRYVQHLVDHSYTVAVYTQQQTKGDKIERVLQGVYSPSVMIGDHLEEETLEEHDRCLLAVLVQQSTFLQKKNQTIYSVSYICVNTTNGKIDCEEETFYHEHDVHAFFQKIKDVYQPQEILLQSCFEMECEEDSIIHTLPSWTHDQKKYKEIGFQQIVLEKVYPPTCSELSIMEEIGLERHPDLLCLLVYVITFLEEHHPLAIYRLQKPSFLQYTDKVAYNTQTLYDLDLFHHQQHKNSLFDILDETSTPAGKRLLRKTMFAPHHNVLLLEKAYEEINQLLPIVQEVHLKKNITFYNTDVEHLWRRIQMGNGSVPSVFRFLKFLLDVDGLVAKLPPHLSLTQEWPSITEIQQFVLTKWDLALLQSWRTWENDTVWKQTPSLLLQKQLEWDEKERTFRKWMEKNMPDMFQRLVFSEDEAYVNATKKIYYEMKDRPDVKIRSMSSSYRVYHAHIDRYFQERKYLLGFLIRTRRQIFQDQVRELVDRYNETLTRMIHYSAYLDMVMSNTLNAVRFRLQRPEPSSHSSVLSLSNVRHLVVEVMNPHTEYIANHVELTQHHGILLFGQNSAGKCFEYNTKMVLWDGTMKHVQDLTLKDVLIGDDGKRRRILTLTHGKGVLYNIRRTDTQEIIMTVNQEHILCLCNEDGTKFLQLSVENILQKPHKYSDMMFQHTRCRTPSFSREHILERQYYMNDEEWNKIYLSFLHSGRRVRYSFDRLVVDNKTIVPIIIEKKTNHGEYFGFGVDSNQCFLMPDGTVSHNSTLMKSVGIAVIMAQCGMFVPCSFMKWTPFTSIFTKIGNRDNIWKGKSTFITEMNELKHILDRSHQQSLVLCDELTSGTETYSATGIVASTLEMLLERKSKFIMTTHLHTLQQFSSLMSHPQLRVMHFSMEYQKENKKLYFDRILREGSGKSIYGLEIAEYLGFPDLFLKKAFQYRSQLDPHSVSLQPKRRSRYNSKKWVDRCENCGTKTDLHTHHILHQKDAKEDGYIGLYHKNKLSNLKILCKTCHEKEHHFPSDDEHGITT